MQFNDPQWILKDRGFSITWTTVRSVVLITCLIIIYLRISQEELRLMVMVSDLGTRELSAIIFFKVVGYPVLPIVLASLLIWAINIFFTSMIGLLVMRKIRI